MSGAAVAGLDTGGWIFLVGAWGGIIVVTAYCFYRLMVTRDRKR